MGDTIVKAVPTDINAANNEGVMCGRGRFGTNQVQLGDRLTKPLVRNAKGQLEETDWYDAFVAIAKSTDHFCKKWGRSFKSRCFTQIYY